jgi:sugar phosphate isomerase/epimerase
MAKNNPNIATFLLSTDTLSGYGLDLIFDTARELNFDGIDLAMWKNFDSRHTEYVKDLVEKYDMPVKVVQISDKANIKEMNQAIELGKEL